MRMRRLGSADAALAREALERCRTADPAAAISMAAVSALLTRPQNLLLVAGDAEGPAGFLLAYLLDRADGPAPMLCLYEIGVAASQRRQGVGRALVEALQGLAHELGVSKTWLVTQRANQAAVGLFEATGASHEAGEEDLVYVYRPGDSPSTTD